MDGKEERLEERDSMADLVLERESNDIEGACSEVGVEVGDGVVGSECLDILEKRERIYWIVFQLNYYRC